MQEKMKELTGGPAAAARHEAVLARRTEKWTRFSGATDTPAEG